MSGLQSVFDTTRRLADNSQSHFQILSAVVFDLVVFHDIPDYWILTGIALIAGAGLCVFGRNAPAAK